MYLHAEDYPRPDFKEMIKTTVRLLEEYDIRFDNSCRIFVDTANPSFITTLKQAVNEDPDYVKQIAFYKHNYPSIYDLQFLQQNMFVIPCHTPYGFIYFCEYYRAARFRMPSLIEVQIFGRKIRCNAVNS